MYSIKSNGHNNSSNDSIVGRYFTYPNNNDKRVAQGGLRTVGKYKHSLPDLPLVTIITVCLNSIKTLEQCVQSVFQQTYVNIEYIVIDGCSTDGTLGLIRKYESAIDYYISEPDRGLYHAMNKGVELAAGDYILILNSDDWYSNDCVEKLVKAKKYSGADFVSALAQYVDADGDFVQALRHMPYDASLRLRMPLRHETMLLSASIYNDIGLYDETYKIIADFYQAVKLFEAGYTLYEIQRPLLFFRNDGLSNTNKSELFLERINLIKVIFPFLKGQEVNVFSELAQLMPKHLLDLAMKYPDEMDFIDSLRLYSNDRIKTDIHWRDSYLKWPESIKKVPLISVVLPVFNAEETLKKCIDSVLLQSLEDLELICINDVSHDESQKIIDNYQDNDSRVISLVNDVNLGLGATRNRGVSEARGTYIYHIDPDDTIPPKALKALYFHAIKYGSDMVKGAYLCEQIIHGKKPQKIERKSLCSDSVPIINTTLKQLPQLLNTTEGHWSYLYTKELARRIPYPTDLKMGQDSIFIVNVLVHAEKISIIDDVVYNYQSNPTSAMNSFTFRKYMDALEWRRRAWHLLDDAELRQIGERMLQSYWGDDFFKSLVNLVSHKQLIDFFNNFRATFKEAGLSSASAKASPLVKQLFKLLIEKQDGRARVLLMSDSVDSKQIQENEINFPQEKINSKCEDREYPNHFNSIKVATFSTLDFGGAGIGTQRRVAALRNQGVDANIYSLCVRSKHGYVVQIKPDVSFGGANNPNLVWRKICEHAVLDSNKVPGFCANELFSNTKSIVDYRKIKNIFDHSDVIHLHWMVGMLDYEHFLEVVNDKPIVWTLADMNAFTGGCHYSEGCEGYKNECQKCPLLGSKSNLAHKAWLIKKALYRKLTNLHIVCPSQWLAECAKKSSLLGDIPIEVIPNPLPINKFNVTNKVVARIKLGLPLNRQLILFGADDITNFRKGGDLLKKMVSELIDRNPPLSIEVIFFGASNLNIDLPSHSLGVLKDEEYLSLVYSAADVYVFPSREDNSPLTVGESLLCGTPVVSFAVGNVPDLVQHKKTGYISDYLSVKSLADGVLWALNASNDSVFTKRGIQCRLAASKVHNPSLSARRHIQLYNKILGEEYFQRVFSGGENRNTIYILTPCLNVVNTIDETIKSVISQAGDFILVYRVQDGGSSDGTLDRLKYWKEILEKNNSFVQCHAVIFSWVSEPDKGMYDAIHKGFDALNVGANCYMSWINGDDLLLPNSLGNISLISDKQPTVEWVGSHTHNVLENGDINTSRPNPTPTEVIREGLCDGTKSHWFHLQQEGTFFKKSLWDKCKHVLKGFKYAGDWGLWREFANHSDYYQLDKPLGAFRIRQGQISSSLRHKYDNEIESVVCLKDREIAFRHWYKERRSLYANVIKISPIQNEVFLEKEIKFVRDYFYKKGLPSAEISYKHINFKNFDRFTYALRPHWELLKSYDLELFGETLNLDKVDLKRYQDLLVYAFIKENVPQGSRIIEVGGGNSRILNHLSGKYECWNVDKLDGIGNGPKHVNNLKGIHLVKDYMGNFNTEIPDNYFDFAFSVSVLEHVPQDNEMLFQNIVADINRVLKNGGLSLHLFDIVFRNGKPRVFNKLISYIFDNVKTANKFFDPIIAHDTLDIYYLSRETYEKIWYKYTKKSYEEFGQPTSLNVLWKK